MAAEISVLAVGRVFQTELTMQRCALPPAPPPTPTHKHTQDEDPVPSTSKKPFTVALVSFGHYVGPLPCALRMGGFLTKEGVERNCVGTCHFLESRIISGLYRCNHFYSKEVSFDFLSGGPLF